MADETNGVVVLRLDEVARGLNLSVATVARRVSDGTVRSVEVGGERRVPWSEYRHLWEASMTAAVSASIDDIEGEIFKVEPFEVG